VRRQHFQIDHAKEKLAIQSSELEGGHAAPQA
jgi:hypothetical protein